jgi:hypothetical protein
MNCLLCSTSVQSYTQASFKVDYWRRSAVVVFMVACGSLVIRTTNWLSPTKRIHLPICWELQRATSDRFDPRICDITKLDIHPLFRCEQKWRVRVYYDSY